METIITTLKAAVLSRVKDDFYLVWGFKGELKSLEERLEWVTAFLSDAESKSSSHAAIELWLKNLRDQVSDADAVLDEFRYEQLRRQIEVEGRCWNEVTDFFSPSNHLMCRLNLARKIKKINSMLDHINERARELGLNASLTNSVNRSENTGSTYSRVWVGDLQNVVGRDKEVSTIVGELVSSENEERLSVIAVVGMAGRGKTTLVHLVCRSESVVSNFNKIIWVSVSDDFEVKRILSDILQVVTEENLGLSSEPALVQRLSQVLKNKKYLLILDDVWSEDSKEWESLKNALLAISTTAAGSRIIVTTRSTLVASTMQASFTLDLERLSQDDSWTLFRQKAFAKGGAEESPELLKIGKEIARRCDGVPLVLSVLGGLLNYKKSEDEWVSIRDHEMWGSIKDIGDRVNDILKLSFDHLSPSSLKLCFSYSSIFPKDSTVGKDSIVQMWVALELLPYLEDESLELEDVGNDYFHQLLGKSLLQEPKTDEYEDVKSCKMHDLVHDLAERTSKGYCFALRGSRRALVIPDTVAHLSLSSPSRETLDSAQGRFGRLQTLFLEGSLGAEMFEKLPLLRVLVLVDSSTVELPNSVEKLKHLRYLDVKRTGIEKLSGPVTRLYNLQTLRIGNIKDVPERLGNLISLRHFYGNGILVGVGKLISLQTLQSFTVNRAQGCLIRELGGLGKLKGELAIRGLEDVENVEEAKGARLSEKPSVKALELYWPKERQHEESCNDKDVLEGLRPHVNLKSLKIENFKGLKLPLWMMSESVSVLRNVVNVELSECDSCEQVPTLGRLPNLKNVRLNGLRNVRRIGAEFYGNLQEGLGVFFPVLTRLVMYDMDNLEEWMDVNQVYPSSSSLIKKGPPYQFPKLEEFYVTACPKLVLLPFSSLEDYKYLQQFTVDECPSIQVIPDLKGLQNLTYLRIGSLGKSTTDFPSGIQTLATLNTLWITELPGVVSVPDLSCLTRLEGLRIGGFSEELDEFPLPFDYSSSSSAAVASSSWSSLRRLELIGWAKLRHLPQQLEHFSATLTNLRLLRFDGLEFLPEWLGNFSSLRSLEIYYCTNLKCMPSKEAMCRLTKLQRLDVYACPLLLEGCGKGKGPEWRKIQHIPNIRFNQVTVQDKRPH